MKGKLSLFSFRLKNFKAVQDSKTIRFTPLTAFIGNKCSGQSGIVEGARVSDRRDIFHRVGHR